MTYDKFSRLAFDEPAAGPLDVKVFDGEGNLIRIIPGALLSQRPKRDLRESQKVHRRGAPMSDVPSRKRTATRDV